MTSATELIVVHETQWSVHILHVFHEVDFANAPALRNEITALGDCPWLIVNLSKCNYIDSAGIRVLCDVQRTQGDRLRLVAQQDTALRRYLHVTRLDKSLAISETVEAALAAFTSQRLVTGVRRGRA